MQLKSLVSAACFCGVLMAAHPAFAQEKEHALRAEYNMKKQKINEIFQEKVRKISERISLPEQMRALLISQADDVRAFDIKTLDDKLAMKLRHEKSRDTVKKDLREDALERVKWLMEDEQRFQEAQTYGDGPIRTDSAATATPVTVFTAQNLGAEEAERQYLEREREEIAKAEEAKRVEQEEEALNREKWQRRQEAFEASQAPVAEEAPLSSTGSEEPTDVLENQENEAGTPLPPAENEEAAAAEVMPVAEEKIVSETVTIQREFEDGSSVAAETVIVEKEFEGDDIPSAVQSALETLKNSPAQAPVIEETVTVEREVNEVIPLEEELLQSITAPVEPSVVSDPMPGDAMDDELRKMPLSPEPVTERPTQIIRELNSDGSPVGRVLD